MPASKLAGSDAPDETRFETGQPDGAEARANAVSPGAVPLPNHFVFCAVDACHRNSEERYPNLAKAKRDFAAWAREPGGNGRDNLRVASVHARNRAVTLV